MLEREKGTGGGGTKDQLILFVQSSLLKKVQKTSVSVSYWY